MVGINAAFESGMVGRFWWPKFVNFLFKRKIAQFLFVKCNIVSKKVAETEFGFDIVLSEKYNGFV